MDREEQDELRLVMGEVASALEGQGSALTLHSDDGTEARILYCHSADGRLSQSDVLGSLERLDQLGNRGISERQWIENPTNDFSHVLSIPVQRVAGFSRLMLMVFFDELSNDQRRRADAAYMQRRPFAVGYFRLWQINRRQSRQIEALEAAVDLIEPGVILLDGRGAPLYTNKGAEALLAAGNGIRQQNGTITAIQRKDALMLRVAIDHIIAGPGNSQHQHAPIVSLTREGASPLLVTVMAPPRAPVAPLDVAAIVYLLDPAIDTEQLFGQLRQLYDLTPVEARLACLLVEGRALTDAAAAMRVKEQSARSCLKQIFAKTRTHRQADLVRLVLSNLIRTSRTALSN